MNEDKLSKIEDLKNKLFNKNYKNSSMDRFRFSYKSKKDVPDTWENTNQNFNFTKNFLLKTSLFKKFFIFSVAIFSVAVMFGLYNFFIGGNSVSNENIKIEVLGNSFTPGGEELPLQIEILNKNNSALELADLVIEYPKSSSDVSSTEMEYFRGSIGTIPAGGIQNQNVKIVLFGEQGSIRPVKIVLEYRVSGSNAIFMKEKIHEVTISSAPINLSVQGPSMVSPNQEVVLKIKTSLNANKNVSKILLRVDYPFGFEFNSAKPSPAFGNNVWVLGDLAPGMEKEVQIVGKMVEVTDGEEKNFNIFSGTENSKDKSMIGTVFNSLAHLISINKPFIQANLYVNGTYSREYTTGSKSSVNGEIRWVNNLDTKINDMVITAKFSGNAFNSKTINSNNGFYDSANNTITWDRNTRREFAEVNPGESGSVSFVLTPGSLFSTAGMLSSPVINVDVSVKGDNPLEGNTFEELKNSESKTIKIVSDVNLLTKILRNSGAFVNSGPMPLKVGSESTYTVVWNISNTANSISKAEVRSSLPSWVNFVGPTSPPSENLIFNPSNRELIWNVGTIGSGAGISGSQREVSFQIGITPSFSQLGFYPTLINSAILTGYDDFANLDISVSKSSITSEFVNDLSVSGRVQE